MVKIETRCRIPIWRTFGRIQWHVIPQPPATLQVLPLGEFTVMIPEPHATLQGAVTWRNQCHDRATLQGVIIPSAMLKIVFAIFYFLGFFFNAVWAMTSGSFCIVSDTLVIYIIQLQRLYFGETGVCSMCCQKLVIAQKYSAEVRWNLRYLFGPVGQNFGKHYKGMFGSTLVFTSDKVNSM